MPPKKTKQKPNEKYGPPSTAQVLQKAAALALTKYPPRHNATPPSSFPSTSQVLQMAAALSSATTTTTTPPATTSPSLIPSDARLLRKIDTMLAKMTTEVTAPYSATHTTSHHPHRRQQPVSSSGLLPSPRRPRPQAFTADDIELLRQILDDDHDDEDPIFVPHIDETIRRGSMQTLRPGVWLTDDPVNIFFQVVLTHRDQQLCVNDPQRKRSHFFNSFFMTKLLKEYDSTNNNKNGIPVVEIDEHDVVTDIIDDTGAGSSSQSSINSSKSSGNNTDSRYDFGSVAQWSKKVPLKDIFELDKMFFPINVSNMHWILGIIDMTKKQILILDSSVNDNDTAVATPNRYGNALYQYVSDEHDDKKKKPLPNAKEWKIITSSSSANSTTTITQLTPQQNNSYDCGVFVCYFAASVSNDYPITSFDQGYIDDNNGRERIALSILNGTVVL